MAEFIKGNLCAAKVHSCFKQDSTFLPHGSLNTHHFVLKEVIFSSAIYWGEENPSVVTIDLIIMEERRKYLQPSFFSFIFFFLKHYFSRAFYLFCCSF